MNYVLRLGICLGFYFMSMWSLSGQLIQEFQVTLGVINSENTLSENQNNQILGSFHSTLNETHLSYLIPGGSNHANDKQVLPSRGFPNNYTLKNEKLTYKIRFQNTGSDTAITVAIKDTLSSLFDLTTIVFTATSHTGVFSVDEDVLTMVFENIYLVDSITNEAESHGFFEFEIGLKNGVEDFTLLENTAYIYFDDNDSIATNTTSSTIVSKLDADTDGYFFWEECDDTNFNINPGNAEIPNNDTDENCDGIIEVFTEEDCNVVFDDFNDYSDGFFVGQTGTENWIFRTNSSLNGSIFSWGTFNVLDIRSNYNQSPVEYDAQIVQKLSIKEAEVVQVSFNYYNECGILALEFYEDSTFSKFADLVITSYDFENFNNAYYIQGDTFQTCHIIPNDFVNYTFQLDFMADELRMLCPSGDTLKVPFYMDASDFYGIGWGSNQCGFISDLCISNVEASLIDMDADGFGIDTDCDDMNASINPGAEEIPNNDVDENCDGIVLIIDEDEDGFNSSIDCDDTNALINPDAEEIPNNEVDENCDGEVLIIDEDEDGFNSDVDCDDANALINPDAEEIPNNEVDENCDGEILTSGISTVDFDKIVIYPNPVSEQLTIDHISSTFSAEILNLHGKKVMFQTSLRDRTNLDLSSIPEGVYFLVLKLETSNETKLFKLVKI